jgi:hypothetical protein
MDISKASSVVVDIHCASEAGGGWRVVVYCAYWIVNRTGLPMYFKDPVTDKSAVSSAAGALSV